MRYQVPNSGKAFAEGDVVSLGPGGQQGTIRRVHVLGGMCEQVDIEMHDPTRVHGEETWISYGTSPRYLVLIEMSEAEKIKLYEGMLRRIGRMVEQANEDADADAWAVLEDIQIASADALTHGVAAMRER